MILQTLAVGQFHSISCVSSEHNRVKYNLFGLNFNIYSFWTLYSCSFGLWINSLIFVDVFFALFAFVFHNAGTFDCVPFQNRYFCL
jgi:hypothetical protein